MYAANDSNVRILMIGTAIAPPMNSPMALSSEVSEAMTMPGGVRRKKGSGRLRM